jgi:hypothetical protein
MKDRHCSALALAIITAFQFLKPVAGATFVIAGFHLKITPAQPVSMGSKTI